MKYPERPKETIFCVIRAVFITERDHKETYEIPRKTYEIPIVDTYDKS